MRISDWSSDVCSSDLGNTTRYDGARGMSMTLNIDAIRREVRALDYARGSSAAAALWRDDDADARANLAIEGLALEPDDRSEERRVGKECDRTCRSWWWQAH